MKKQSIIMFSSLCGFSLAQESPKPLETIVVSANKPGSSIFEQFQPISVVNGDNLLLKKGASVADVLFQVPGVTTTSYGPLASRPVIRSLDADRIRIVQNGLNTIDASATSVDHALTYDPISLKSVEVLRGPATLLYGPNAIGGVVYLEDGRIPTKSLEKPIQGEVTYEYDTVNSGDSRQVIVEGGKNGLNYHLEAYKKGAQAMDIPGFARSEQKRAQEPLDSEEEAKGTLPNSQFETEGLSIGTSYTSDQGYLGLSHTWFNTNYGSVLEDEVTLDMEQRRWDLKGALYNVTPLIEAIDFSFALASYEHTEFEGAEAGTLFENEGFDSRIEIKHSEVHGWKGRVGTQWEVNEFNVIGEEKFLPRTISNSGSLFLIEEKALSQEWTLQAGLRYDLNQVEADRDELMSTEAHESEFNLFNSSFGVIWNPQPDYAVALALSLAERAPTYQELYANGPHIATSAYEIGNRDFDKELAKTIDLSFRKKEGKITGSTTFFYSDFDDYIGLFPRGEEMDELPVYDFKTVDASFYGNETELTYHFFEKANANQLDLQLSTSWMRAENETDDSALPRIAPFHFNTAVVYSQPDWQIRLESKYVGEQNRVTDFELPTDSYLTWNASFLKRFAYKDYAATFYLKGINLTDEEMREHTSIVKDIAPLRGRGVVCGVNLSF